MENIESFVSDPCLGLVWRGSEMFRDSNPFIPSIFSPSRNFRVSLKIKSSFSLPDRRPVIQNLHSRKETSKSLNPMLITSGEEITSDSSSISTRNTELVTYQEDNSLITQLNNASSKKSGTPLLSSESRSLTNRSTLPKVTKPQWHAPWELSAVVSGHLGWVRSIAFDPSNEWFATGSSDRTIKIWDLAKVCAGAEGGLKLTLTGHISAIRGLAVSPRHPYLFSAGEDKLVKCWDLEYNKVIRHYHGHLSGVYCLSLHPTLDVLVTGGRDSVARVWDIRTKHQIHVLGGHSSSLSSIITNTVDPQIITGSHDSTVKLWDLAAGRAMATLTQHKKSIRSIIGNPKEMSFVSASADNMKKWQCRDGKFLKNLTGHNSIINSLAINEDGVLVSCGDNGSMQLWDYDTGYCFQKTKTVVQPGSLDAEAGIFASSFDLSGSRLITCEADKSIKVWRENTEATEDSHPIDMKAWTKQCLTLKKY